ncbi:MAG: response regulator [Janthinobacterium lividum]
MSNPLSGRHVLVVEDEMLVLMDTEDMLGDLGCCSVTAAATVEQAIALIGAKTFDFALLDINLDGTLSHPVADALAARGVPFVVATGYSSQYVSEIYRDRPILNKPFYLPELTTALSRIKLTER